MKKKIALLVMAAAIIGLTTGCAGSSTYGKYVKLGEYKGLSVDMITTQVTDEDIEYEIQTALEENAEYNDITDRGIQEGDNVNIDFTGTIDGESFDGGDAEDFELIVGEGYMLEEFETKMIGGKTGETLTFDVTFPEDYDETLGGQTATFQVTINAIQEVVTPEYNDAFVAEISDYTTTEEYEANLREQLTSDNEENNASTAASDLLSQVIQNAEISGYPQELYDSCKAEYDETNQYYADMFGMDIEELAGSEEESAAAVEEMVNQQMVITEIAEAEKLTLSDSEYDTFINDSYEEYGYESGEDFVADYGEETLKSQLLTMKVENFLLSNATINEVTEDEYYGEMSDDSDMELEIDETDMETEGDTEA